MSVSVRIPAQIRNLYGAQSRERVEADTVADLITALDARYPGIGERLTEPDGQLRRWVNVFVDGQDIRIRDGITTPLTPGSEVYIVPSVAGGCFASAHLTGTEYPVSISESPHLDRHFLPGGTNAIATIL